MLAAFWLCSAGVASAHDARPLLVNIVGHEGPVYRVDMRVPPTVLSFNQPEIQWPASCAVRSAGSDKIAGETAVRRMLLSCAAPLEGERIVVRYPVLNPTISTLIRYTPVDGQTRMAVLPPNKSEWQIPRAPGWGAVARDYAVLGIEHIWLGLDHLLFVAGLLLLAGTWRQMLMAITGFTAAHSITLASSALGFVTVPSPPTEAAIALSIIFVAREIVRGDRASLSARRPMLVASAFGLLHGFGFAGALAEAGLPREDITTALLFFNIGVEVGQVVFIICCAGLMAAGRRAVRAVRDVGWQPQERFAKRVGGYGIGMLAGLWFIERVGVLIA